MKEILILVKYYLTTFFRNKLRLTEMIFWPILELGMFGLLGRYFQTSSVSHLLTILLGGIIFWHFFYRVTGEVTQQLVDDVYSRNFQNILVAPINHFQLLSAIVLSSLLKLGLSMLMILSAGWILFRFNILVVGSYGPLMLLIIILWGIEVGLFITGLLFLFGHKIMGMVGVLIVLLQPFTCVFYSCSTLPGWAGQVSRLIPSSYVFEMYRQQLLGSESQSSAFLVPLVLLLLYAAALIYYWKSCYNYARKTGMLVRL